MTQEKIINEFHQLLDMHLKGTLGYIGQEPYKGDFFKLFKEAYRNNYFDASSHPRLTGDALRDVLVDRWLSRTNEKENKRKRELMEQLLLKWDEWRYAWDHY